MPAFATLSHCRCFDGHCRRWFPWQVPPSQFDVLADALRVLEARCALWESIGAWDDMVARWWRAPFAERRIHDKVPITRHLLMTAHAAHMCCGCKGGIVRKVVML
jgi:hypothetical protein